MIHRKSIVYFTSLSHFMRYMMQHYWNDLQVLQRACTAWLHTVNKCYEEQSQ